MLNTGSWCSSLILLWCSLTARRNWDVNDPEDPQEVLRGHFCWCRQQLPCCLRVQWLKILGSKKTVALYFLPRPVRKKNTDRSDKTDVLSKELF